MARVVRKKKTQAPKKFYVAAPGDLHDGEDVLISNSLPKAIRDAKFHLDEGYDLVATIYELIPVKRFVVEVKEQELSK